MIEQTMQLGKIISANILKRKLCMGINPLIIECHGTTHTASFQGEWTPRALGSPTGSNWKELITSSGTVGVSLGHNTFERYLEAAPD